jgi:uncharacterized alkaline shock family protein YloU
VQSDIDVQELARKVQLEVSRAITEIIGLRAGDIIVHIEDVEPPPPQ